MKGSWVLFRFVPGAGVPSRGCSSLGKTQTEPFSATPELDELQSDLGPSLRNLPQDISHPTRRSCSASLQIWALSYNCHEQGRHEGSSVFCCRQDATSACDSAHSGGSGPSERPPEGLWPRHFNGNSRAKKKKAASRAHGVIGKRTVSHDEACCLVFPCSTAAGQGLDCAPSHKSSRSLRDVAGRTAASVIRPRGGHHLALSPACYTDCWPFARPLGGKNWCVP